MSDCATIICGDALTELRKLPDESVNCCVTSPPYWGLRDYGVEGQIGLESSPQAFIGRLVEVFSEVRRVLRKDGTLWLNLGDTYASTWSCGRRNAVGSGACDYGNRQTRTGNGIKEKDLVGIPWRVAFALQLDGWFLRQDIIWSKPNPMPESVRDRCTKSHEYVFLLSKSPKYNFNSEAIAEVAARAEEAIYDNGKNGLHSGASHAGNGSSTRKFKAGTSGNLERKPGSARGCPTDTGSNVCGSVPWEGITRNRRSVWTVATRPYPGAHFATFPPELIEPMVLAGCPVGGTVLDPFAGSGTTLEVAQRLGRKAIGVELNPQYVKLIHKRLRQGYLPLDTAPASSEGEEGKSNP